MANDKAYSSYELRRIEKKLREDFDRDDPQDYEVKIDGLLVISRTDDPDKFSTIRDQVSERHTEEIEIRIYRGKSQHNDTYVLYLEQNKVRPGSESSPSLEGVRLQLREEFEREKQELRREWEHRDLQKKFDELEGEHSDLEKRAIKLEKELEEIKSKKLYLGDISLIDVGGAVLEGFVRRNPQMLAKIPGGEALAGIIEADNEEKARQGQNQVAPDDSQADYSFETADQSPAVSPEDVQYLELLKQIQGTFSQNEFLQVMMLLDSLSDHPELIPEIERFLQNQGIEPEDKQEPLEADLDNSNQINDEDL